jgi:hypothetical protein
MYRYLADYLFGLPHSLIKLDEFFKNYGDFIQESLIRQKNCTRRQKPEINI